MSAGARSCCYEQSDPQGKGVPVGQTQPAKFKRGSEKAIVHPHVPREWDRQERACEAAKDVWHLHHLRSVGPG